MVGYFVAPCTPTTSRTSARADFILADVLATVQKSTSGAEVAGNSGTAWSRKEPKHKL